MPNKTLSVPEKDLPLWTRAEREAERRRMSMSGLVLASLSEQLGGDMDTIAVRVGTEFVRFSGRWIVDPDLNSSGAVGTVPGDPYFADPELSADPRQWRAGVAETARGRVAIYLHHWNYDYRTQEVLHDFDSLDEARAELWNDPRIWEETWTEARQKLDRRNGGGTSWRDI